MSRNGWGWENMDPADARPIRLVITARNPRDDGQHDRTLRLSSLESARGTAKRLIKNPSVIGLAVRQREGEEFVVKHRWARDGGWS